jgi:hypothetical protein
MTGRQPDLLASNRALGLLRVEILITLLFGAAMSAINRLLLTGATAALLTLSATTAEARPFRVTQIPNGADFGCTSCHTSPAGGARNSFGTAVAAGFTSAPSSPITWLGLPSLHPKTILCKYDRPERRREGTFTLT